MGAFEDFVNLELPRRPALLTYEITGYQGDPNNASAPAVIKGSPKGTFYLSNSDGVLWRKTGSSATSWVQIAGGGAGSVSALVGATPYLCPAMAVVGDLVYLDGSDEVALAMGTSLETMPAIGVIQAKLDDTHCVVQMAGDVPAYSGLVPDTRYFVSDTNAGKLMPYPPTGEGHVLQVVGTPRNATTLILSVDATDYFVL